MAEIEIELEAETEARLRALAAAREMSVEELVREVICRGLAGDEEKDSPR